MAIIATVILLVVFLGKKSPTPEITSMAPTARASTMEPTILCVTNDRLEEFCPVETTACRNRAACNNLIDTRLSKCMFPQDIIDGPDLCWIKKGGNSGRSLAWEAFNDLVSCVQNMDCDQEDVI